MNSIMKSYDIDTNEMNSTSMVTNQLGIALSTKGDQGDTWVPAPGTNTKDYNNKGKLVVKNDRTDEQKVLIDEFNISLTFDKEGTGASYVPKTVYTGTCDYVEEDGKKKIKSALELPIIGTLVKINESATPEQSTSIYAPTTAPIISTTDDIDIPIITYQNNTSVWKNAKDANLVDISSKGQILENKMARMGTVKPDANAKTEEKQQWDLAIANRSYVDNQIKTVHHYYGTTPDPNNAEDFIYYDESGSPQTITKENLAPGAIYFLI